MLTQPTAGREQEMQEEINKLLAALEQEKQGHDQDVQDMYNTQAIMQKDAERTDTAWLRKHLACMEEKGQLLKEAWEFVRSQTADRNRYTLQLHGDPRPCAAEPHALHRIASSWAVSRHLSSTPSRSCLASCAPSCSCLLIIPSSSPTTGRSQAVEIAP